MYENGLPPSLRTIRTLCRIRQSTRDISHLYHQAITSAVENLLVSISTTHTFTDKLALAQSLILLQVITLLFPLPAVILKNQAENRMPLLKNYIQELYRSTPNTLPSFMSRYQAWLLAESCRRTLHIAHMVEGIHSVMSRGSFTLTPFVVSLPFDLNRAWIWEDNANNELERDLLRPTELISYRELIELWENGELRKPSQFVEMLLVACKGVDEIRPSITIT